MILAIDMGNTNIVLGGIDEKQTYFIERVTTDQAAQTPSTPFTLKTSWKCTTSSYLILKVLSFLL